MSADRELLELAACAAGIYVKHPVFNQDDDLIALRVKPSVEASRQTITDWNPLTDDGDALRLTTALGLVVDARYKDGAMRAFNSVCYWLKADDTGMVVEFGPHEKHEFQEATRRAIVRAAAEIGRATTQTERDKP